MSDKNIKSKLTNLNELKTKISKNSKNLVKNSGRYSSFDKNNSKTLAAKKLSHKGR